MAAHVREKQGSSALAMTKSELIELLARKQKHLPAKDVELAVKHLLELMSNALASGERSIRFRLPFVVQAEEIDQGLERVGACLAAGVA